MILSAAVLFLYKMSDRSIAKIESVEEKHRGSKQNWMSWMNWKVFWQQIWEDSDSIYEKMSMFRTIKTQSRLHVKGQK